MEDNINKNEKGVENGPDSLESVKDGLENVIIGNKEKEIGIMGKFNDLSDKIEEKIPEAFGDEPSPEKNDAIDREKSLEKKAVEVVEEYNRLIGKITNEGNDAQLAKDAISSINAEGEKELSNEEIESVIENYLNSKKGVDEKEKKDFGDFIKEKIDKAKSMPVTRRDFLKLLAGVAIALISKDYILDNINAWWAEYREQKENNYEIVYSKEMTALYEGVKDLPSKDAENEDINKNIIEIEKSFEFARFIKNSEKESIDDLADNLAKSDIDAILFGEMHGPETNGKNAKEILEKFKSKSNKKIAKICLESLDFKDFVSVELTKKFNQKQISADFFQKELNLIIEFPVSLLRGILARKA